MKIIFFTLTSSVTLFCSTKVFAQQPGSINIQLSTVVTLPVGASPSALAIADYNQDGRADIAVCQRGLNSVGVYLQGIGGAFPSTPTGTYTIGTAPSGLVAVPLGMYPARPTIDLVAISGPSNLYTFLTNNNNGSGAFTPVTYQNYFGQATNLVNPQLLARDLDGDGFIDFAYTLDPTVFVRDGGAYWQRTVSATNVAYGADSYKTAYRPSSLALDDFNRDGFVDVVLTNPTGNEFTAVLANSGPQWYASGQVQRASSAGTTPVSITTGDVNGDLLPDLAIAHAGSSEITLFLNSRTAGFGTPASYPLSAAPSQVLLQDINNDRLLDMLVTTADGKLQIFPHTGATGLGRYGTPIQLAAGNTPAVLQVADMDGDFLPDVVVGCTGDNTVRVYLNRSGILNTRAAQLKGVEIYPNPAHDYLAIKRLNISAGLLTATLLDALGREMRRTKLISLETSMPLAGLPAGVYMLRLESVAGILTQRVTVE